MNWTENWPLLLIAVPWMLLWVGIHVAWDYWQDRRKQ